MAASPAKHRPPRSNPTPAANVETPDSTTFFKGISMRLSARFFVAAIVAATFLSSAFAADWPQWLGPDRDGLTKETGLLKELPEGGPKRVWLFENCGNGYAGFSIVDGALFTMGGRDEKCQLIALDANTGQELWSVELGPMLENGSGDGPRSTPTVEDGFVYALGGKGALVCVRAADGSEVWRTNLEEELDKDTWMVRRSVEAVLGWYAKTAAEPAIRQAADRAKFLLARSIETRRTRVAPEQRTLFDDLEDEFLE
jgi:hypothetical protein